MEGDNHPKLREVREERDRIVRRLTEAFAHDELAIAEFEQRIADAYRLGTTHELRALVADLEPQPTAEIVVREAPAVEVVATVVPPARPLAARAILGSVERTGSFPLGDGARASAVLGSLVIDLRGAALPVGLVELHVRAVLGSIEIIVPADVAVECEGTGILGSFEGSSRVPADLDPSAPRLRIVGSAILGSIEVHVRPPAHVTELAARLRGRAVPRLE